MENRKKTFVEDIERTLYDIRNEDRSAYKSQAGLTEAVVRDISARKHDPEWMLERRLESLKVYNSLRLPAWGPDLSELNMEEIVTCRTIIVGSYSIVCHFLPLNIMLSPSYFA